MNKKAIQLSVNFIVMLILAIAVFVGGLVFTGKFFDKAKEIKGSLDSQTEQQLEKMLDTGSRVVIPIKKKEIFRNKFDTFAIGVLSEYKGKYTVEIKVPPEMFKPAPDKGDIITNDYPKIILQSDTGNPYKLQKDMKPNEKWKNMIVADVPRNAPRGTYIYTVTVGFETADELKAESTPNYDNPLQFMVVVP